MRKQNIFDGDSYRAIFTGLIYKRLISRLWFTNTNVMADAIGKPLTCNVSDCDNYVPQFGISHLLNVCFIDLV